MKNFYLILILLLYVPSNLKAQWEVLNKSYKLSVNTNSILKPIIIDFSKCSCVDSTSNVNYCLNKLKDSQGKPALIRRDEKISDDLSLLDIISVVLETDNIIATGPVVYFNNKSHFYPITSNIFDESITNSSIQSVLDVKLHLNSLNNDDIANEIIIKNTVYVKEQNLIKAIVIGIENKNYLWLFHLGHDSQSTHVNSDGFIESTINSETRKVNLSNNSLLISRYTSKHIKEGHYNNKDDTKEYYKTIIDTMGVDGIFKYDYPNFIKVNH